jgi:hypothetical protein
VPESPVGLREEIIALADQVQTGSKLYTSKIQALAPRFQALTFAGPSSLEAIERTLNKLTGTTKVMTHKVVALQEKAAGLQQESAAGKKLQLAAIKTSLQVQLDVVRLANKQADILLKQIDSVGKG